METPDNSQLKQPEVPVLPPNDGPYDPSKMFTTNDVEDPNLEPEPAPSPEPEPEPAAPTESPELLELRAKLEALENKAPEVSYAVPDELVAAVTNPETFKDIVRIQSMSDADAIKEEIKLANPWATTDEDLEALLKERFPDYDSEIPENHGMDAVTLKRFKFMAEGQKAKMLTDATNQLQEKIKSFVPAPKEEAPFDEKAFEATVLSHIEESVAAYKAPDFPAIDGYALNTTVDMDKVRELAKSATSGPFYAKDGMILPDVNAIADRVLLNQLREQLKPMADALLRKAPEATKEAILRSLNNTPPPVPASGPDPNTYKQRNSGRYEGLQIASVSN